MRFWNTWFENKGRSTPPSGDARVDDLVSMRNQIALDMHDAFRAHMKRARANTGRDASASAILDKISNAFDRCTEVAGTIVGNILQGREQDAATIVCHDDLKLRYGITIFKSPTRTAYTYFTEYGGYMEWLGNTVIAPDLVEKARQKEIPVFVHLIFVIDNQKVFAHLCVVPNGRENNSPLTLLPMDLLTEQERNMLGTGNNTKVSIRCAKCGTVYTIGVNAICVTDSDVMDWLKGGGATVVGKLSSQTPMIGKASPDHKDIQNDKQTILGLAPKHGWKCGTCQITNSWQPIRR